MKAAAGGTVTVRQIRSGIGFNEQQKRTLKAMGLGKVGRERTFPDNEAVRGMIQRVVHLLAVEQGGSRKA